MPSDTEFHKACLLEIDAQSKNSEFKELSLQWTRASIDFRYSYHFEWLGIPIIQYPQDILMIQELLWRVKPDLIIETGVARGGSVIFYASMLSY